MQEAYGAQAAKLTLRTRGGTTRLTRQLRRSSDYFDARSAPWNVSQPCISRHERCPEHLGQREIDRIVRRRIVAQLPDPGQQVRVGVALEINSPRCA